jgi:hypothetical protein
MPTLRGLVDWLEELFLETRERTRSELSALHDLADLEGLGCAR